ncbi:MAG: cation transporter [Prosthecobacter sp.]|nr:cation transporter [Prosthecobacter sp.]
MKTPLIVSLALLSVASLTTAAETTVTLSGVHNCCKSCNNGIIGAAKDIKDVTVTPEGKTVKIVAKSKMNAKKAVEAIIAAGYFGTSDAESPSASSSSSAAKPGKKLTSATVTGAHLCCKKCVTAVEEAVKSVPGVTGSTVVAKETTFTVQGDFTESDLLTALNKAGFNGTIGK